MHLILEFARSASLHGLNILIKMLSGNLDIYNIYCSQCQYLLQISLYLQYLLQSIVDISISRQYLLQRRGSAGIHEQDDRHHVSGDITIILWSTYPLM